MDDVDFDPGDFDRLLVLETGKALLHGDFVDVGSPFWMSIGILGAFLITRGITRLIRRRGSAATPSAQASAGPIRDVVIGGVHIHHQVFGISLMFLGGLVIIAVQPTDTWLDVVAVVLVITAIATSVAGYVEIVFLSGDLAELWWLPWALFLITFVPAAVCLLKGTVITGALGVLYQPIGIVGMIRLAKPRSWWARHFYGAGSGRRRRSERRFDERYAARLDRIRDLVGGAASPPPAGQEPGAADAGMPNT